MNDRNKITGTNIIWGLVEGILVFMPGIVRKQRNIFSGFEKNQTLFYVRLVGVYFCCYVSF